MKETILTTSWDDGHPLDSKLAKLLKKYYIPGTFYICINNNQRKCMNLKQIRKISEDFDIGGHTMNHVDLTRASTKKAIIEISNGKKILEEICNKEIVSFCYPWGKFSQETIDIVKEMGFKGARTTELFSRRVADLFRMGTTVHAYNPYSKRPYRRFILEQLQRQLEKKDFHFVYFLIKKGLLNKSWDQIAIGTLEFILKYGGIWHLWGHSWEIEKYKDWERLKHVFQKIEAIKRKHDVRMLSNSDFFLRANSYMTNPQSQF